MDPVALDRAPMSAGVDMEFLSPLVVSSGNPAENPVPAFSTLGLRLEGLARWHGLTLAAVDWGAMRAEAAGREPVCFRYRTGLRHAKTEIEKTRAETCAQNPPIWHRLSPVRLAETPATVPTPRK
jgi:hypothetical protein